MHLYYVIFAITATVLVSTNAVSADAQQDQISQTVSEIVAATQIDNRVKREEEGSIDSLNDSEERGGGVISSDLMKIVKSRNTPIHLNIAELNPNQQNKIVDILSGQTRTLEKFAKKLGMSSAQDTTHVNFPFFERWSHLFRDGKKPKKHREPRATLEVVGVVLSSLPLSQVGIRLSPVSETFSCKDSAPRETYGYDLVYLSVVERRGIHADNAGVSTNGVAHHFRSIYKLSNEKCKFT
ncbi:hypothetical protein GQ600_15982 [Phytophthora cactorum]|nr:hypothetical protein GQ600_15982 [Phytophthora cactorum]